jgi:hypothetical protein
LNKAPSSTASDLECRLSSRHELSMGLQVNLVYSQHLSMLGTLQRTVVAPVLSLVLVCHVLLFCHQSVPSFQRTGICDFQEANALSHHMFVFLAPRNALHPN